MMVRYVANGTGSSNPPAPTTSGARGGEQTSRHDSASSEAPAVPEAHAKRNTSGTQGRVYFIQAILGGPVKVGWATDLPRRLSELQVGSPVVLGLLGQFAGTKADEETLHGQLRALHSHGEWFIPGEALEGVFMERLGLVPSAYRGNREVIPPQEPQRPGPRRGRRSPPGGRDLMEEVMRGYLKRLRERDPAEARRVGAEWKRNAERMERRRCRKCGGHLGREVTEHRKVCPGQKEQTA